MRNSSVKPLLLCALLSLGLCSCVQKMGTEGHLLPLSGAIPAGASSRRAPEGTVPQAAESPGPTLRALPRPLTGKLVRQGREQYGIYCMPCHGPSGYGDGMIVQRGFLAPPSYHTDRLRAVSDGHLYDVITHGFGAMYSYADRVREGDRWAIVAYVRALQLSQNAKRIELDASDLRKLPAAGEPGEDRP